MTRPVEGSCPELIAAMRYSLLASGKRVRPLLALLMATHFGEDTEALIDFGCALELVHCASLILDDLPCMDDARLRRGQPACHIEYGEATASLAAIALLNLASGVLARDERIDPSIRCTLIDQLSTAVGAGGLVSGQSRDLLERQHKVSSEQMRGINHQKTGVLFELAVVGSATLIGLEAEKHEQLHGYALHLGQAFQTADDLLDCGALAADSGKDCNADRAKGGSVHALGKQALGQRLALELAATHAALPSGSGPYAGLPEHYLNQLFARFG
ncbi:MAG: polyprenyl synthetase family protein [Pseudomonadota bacterium]